MGNTAGQGSGPKSRASGRGLSCLAGRGLRFCLRLACRGSRGPPAACSSTGARARARCQGEGEVVGLIAIKPGLWMKVRIEGGRGRKALCACTRREGARVPNAFPSAVPRHL